MKDIPFYLAFALLVSGCAAAPAPGPQKGFVRHMAEGEVLHTSPKAIEIIKITPEESAALGLAMTQFKSPEARISVHAHEFEDEAFFVHKGSGTMILGDQRVPVSAGDVIFVPRGEWHGFENDGNDTILVWSISPSRYLELHRRFFGPPPSDAEGEKLLREHGYKQK
jgi:mannose-6-phosphate isomerase-like protein (cupin superfamily)